MLRDIGGGVPKFIPYPFPINIVPLVGKGMQPKWVKPFSKVIGEFENVCLWSGCRSDQTSADACINGVWQGAFTWAVFYSFYKLGSADLSRSRLHSRIKNLLSAKGYEQEPVLECSDEMKNGRFTE